MKYLIIAFMFLSNLAMASDPVCSEENSAEQATETMEIKTDVPKFLQGAKICVKLADGKESCAPAEKFKVVPRKQQFIVTKTEKSKVLSCTTNTPRKNRVAVLGGHGAQSGLSSSRSGSTTTVESNVGVVGGAQYQRMLGERISVGVQGQTNKTGSLLLGVDF